MGQSGTGIEKAAVRGGMPAAVGPWIGPKMQDDCKVSESLLVVSLSSHQQTLLTRISTSSGPRNRAFA